ncbi:MAG: hypothetical protein RIR47_340, partial [Bacteroidota bacterium]
LFIFMSFAFLMACAQKPKNQKKQVINMKNTETITLGSGCFGVPKQFIKD